MKGLSTIVTLVLLIIIMFITSSCGHRSPSTVKLRPVAYYKGYVVMDVKLGFKDGNTMVIANDSIYKTIKPTNFEANYYSAGDTIK